MPQAQQQGTIRDVEPEIARLAERGWRLFPCAVGGKKPLLKGWPTKASFDLSMIRQWAVQHPGCNWALATGHQSGLFVLDVDGEPGRAELAALEAKHGALPLTLTSITGRDGGGEHRWFNYPAGREIRNSAGKLGKGLDGRGDGGYVIVPPSIHETGRPYQWVEPQRPVVDAPTWLLELLTGTTEKPRISPAEPTFNLIPEGRRNDTLTRLAGYLRRMGQSQAEIETALLDANTRRCIPPLPETEVRNIAASVARYPIGGPDPLESAWAACCAVETPKGYNGFIQLARGLQQARQGQPIILPLKKIAGLFHVHLTAIQQWRKRAVASGLLEPVGQYIAHRKAGTYLFKEEAKTLTIPLPTITIGLVRVANPSPIVRVEDSPHSYRSPVSHSYSCDSAQSANSPAGAETRPVEVASGFNYSEVWI